MNTTEFDYFLPEELIAQSPLEKRDNSRFLIYHKKSKTIEHRHFSDLIDYLNSGDCLVVNDTKVIPARIIGTKIDTEAVIELLLLKDLGNDLWETLTKTARRVKVGTIIKFSEELSAKCIEERESGIRIYKLLYKGILLEILERLGTMPLPPYIHKQLKDKNRYQTVYAKNLGSAAAPTAGLHFTSELLKKIQDKGVNIAYLTLHVGLGTFRPVEVNDVKNHKMHSEYYELDKINANKINECINSNNKLIVVGTTSVRTLESIANKHNCICEDSGNTDIFIYPGYKFKVVENLITNFHLPKSTLIMLLASLTSKEEILNIYNIAVTEKYRFFSFGDSMFVVND